MKQINTKAIEARMEALNLNQQKLSEKAGLNTSTICKILAGKNKEPTVQTMAAIAETLKTPIENLLM